MLVMSNTDINRIETGVDKLLHLINDNDEISLSDAARELKVPKHVVEMWCDTLEDGGLITTKLTLKERYLISQEYGKLKSNCVDTFIRQIKSMNANITTREDIMLKDKETDINKKLKLIESKLAEIRKHKDIKAEFLVREKQLSEKEKFLESHEKDLKRMEAMLEAKDEDVRRKLSELNTASDVLSSVKVQLAQSQMTVRQMEKDLRRRLSGVEKKEKNLARYELVRDTARKSVRELMKREKAVQKLMSDIVDESQKLSAEKQNLEDSNATLQIREKILQKELAALAFMRNDLLEKNRELESRLRPDDQKALRSLLKNEGVHQFFGSSS